MKPLNPNDTGHLLWLAGDATEIDAFLKAVESDAVVLGHPDDGPKTLMKAMTANNAMALNPYVKEGVEITFLLLQGKVIGLLKGPRQPAK